MSRKAILLSVGLYFLAAVAFGVFRVVTNPFLSGLNAAAVGNAVGGALLLYGGAGLLPVLGWALYRFKRSEEHTSELQSLTNLVCRLLLEKKKTNNLTLRFRGREALRTALLPRHSVS